MKESDRRELHAVRIYNRGSMGNVRPRKQGKFLFLGEEKLYGRVGH